MISDVTFWLIGVICGLVVAAILQGASDKQAIEKGWMTHRGSIYLLTPAKPVPSP